MSTGSGRRRGVKATTELGKPPLSTSALAKRIGMSASFVRMEITLGEIGAIRVGHGRRRVYRIPFDEAMRYLRQLGLL